MLKRILDDCIKGVVGLKEMCDRCLKTERHGGGFVLMVVDASFASMGLCYFTTTVPEAIKEIR